MRADKTPTVIILGGQPGAGKTELEKIAATELGGNVLACNADIFRDYHPHAKYIRANLEDQLPELTAPAAQRWNNAIRAYCEANRFNYILETTFSSGAMMNDTIKDLKTKGYRVGIKLLALHPKLSLLGTHLRFERGKSEEGTGRTVGKKVHDERFEKIIPTLTAVELAARYDKLELYGRDPEGVVLIVSNPPDAVKIYRWEIEKDWPDAIAQNFYDTTISVAAMKIARNAPEQEVLGFLNEMKFSYGLTLQEKLTGSVKLEPKQPRIRRGHGPKL